MGKSGLFDLEKHFAFYGAYHSNPSCAVLNFGFLFTIIHAVFYMCLDKKAGSLAALLCIACWVGASQLAHTLGFSLAWKVVLAAQLFCGTGQFLGHGIFEVLQIVFEYEPYPGFRTSVQAKIAAEIKEWQEKKQKKIS
ncbi:hypothetical protein JRO89_XS13G0247000 [Xanthoceras sorbifolium]|uniref:Uncharacterized protein n=1 Tax=Xanthoceras sorbifolium TaxID=99658 RepID=A0ABQ8H9S6_9ROSI|nr:hypothetical protein JRO89_XS13G0247000 [Xanthoceras sorbifolium]